MVKNGSSFTKENKDMFEAAVADNAVELRLLAVRAELCSAFPQNHAALSLYSTNRHTDLR